MKKLPSMTVKVCLIPKFVNSKVCLILTYKKCWKCTVFEITFRNGKCNLEMTDVILQFCMICCGNTFTYQTDFGNKITKWLHFSDQRFFGIFANCKITKLNISKKLKLAIATICSPICNVLQERYPPNKSKIGKVYVYLRHITKWYE